MNREEVIGRIAHDVAELVDARTQHVMFSTVEARLQRRSKHTSTVPSLLEQLRAGLEPGTDAEAAFTDPRVFLRGILRFHTATKGWSDIAYNLAVDQPREALERVKALVRTLYTDETNMEAALHLGTHTHGTEATLVCRECAAPGTQGGQE